ncbi:multidrug transporter [Paenibacillus sambharensis]|uniref:Multidrug transporter n=1 Tax=Paenibacillus sambharensis TaxID=1803190 RepID=A0A2W1L804_9BACL|nr:Flp1 family type IVb pilin [Paenibacillus sambharensis]PZD94949.1 multidrug transporter [Paenibacillus sambharensis]
MLTMMKNHARKLWKSEEGLGTLEVILIIAVIIIIVILFRSWIVEFLTKLMGKAETRSNEIFS